MRIMTQLLRGVVLCLVILAAPGMLHPASASNYVCELHPDWQGEWICTSCAYYSEGCSKWDDWFWACCHHDVPICVDGGESRPGACHEE